MRKAGRILVRLLLIALVLGTATFFTGKAYLAWRQESLTSFIGQQIITSAELFNVWVSENPDHPAGAPISDKGIDEPAVGLFTGELRGVPVPSGAAVYPLWVLQRGLDWFETQSAANRQACHALLEECGGDELLRIRLARRITRVQNRMAVE